MKRIQGNGILAECVNPKLQKWIIRWDVQPCYRKDEESGEQRQEGYDYYEQWFNYKPSMQEVKETVLNGYNAIIDQEIISGFVWKEMPIWLSTENQFNYKAAYDLAVQTGGGNLPIMFKFGDTENPVYYTFYTLEDISDFYIKAMTYINTKLSDGWQQKDTIDWSGYNRILNPQEYVMDEEIDL